MREFNTTGTCYPQLHYMVDFTKRLDSIYQRVARGTISPSTVDVNMAKQLRFTICQNSLVKITWCFAETRDRSRTDMIIDYLGTQYIIEMKIWHGNAYNERGERQLTEYFDYYHVKKGYMLSFNFNKTKVSGIKTLKIGDKEIVEAMV